MLTSGSRAPSRWSIRCVLVAVLAGAFTLAGASPAAAAVTVNDSYNTPAGATLEIGSPGILANDTLDTARELARLQTDVANGLVKVSGNGSFTYVPNQGFVGVDRFTYCLVLSTSACVSKPATVTIVVGISAADDSYGTPAGQRLSIGAPGVLGNDVVPFGAIARRQSAPSHGTAALATNGALTYTPDAGYAGSDSFTYCIGNIRTCVSKPATVRIAVAPVANDDSYATAQDHPLSVTAPGVLANDIAGAQAGALLRRTPLHGSAALNSGGAFTYTPADGFSGTDSYTYCLGVDGECRSRQATVTVRVRPLTSSSAPPSSSASSSPSSGPPSSSASSSGPSSSAPPTSKSPSGPTASTPVTTSGPPGGELVLKKRTLVVGTDAVASGTDCAPNSTVTLQVEGADVATTTADATGKFEASFVLPELAVGEHVVTADCGRLFNAAFDVVQSSQVAPASSTLLVLVLFILLGIALFRMQAGFGGSARRKHG